MRPDPDNISLIIIEEKCSIFHYSFSGGNLGEGGPLHVNIINGIHFYLWGGGGGKERRKFPLCPPPPLDKTIAMNRTAYRNKGQLQL